MENRFIKDGIERLRSRWPQAHSLRSDHGAHLIVVPSVFLPGGWITYVGDRAENCSICTVLFVAPPGFPASCPADFFTDIEIRHAYPKHEIAYHTHPSRWSGNAEGLLRPWPQWTKSQWWKWRLQMWNPNHSSLFTYMKAVQQRFLMRDPWHAMSVCDS